MAIFGKMVLGRNGNLDEIKVEMLKKSFADIVL